MAYLQPLHLSDVHPALTWLDHLFRDLSAGPDHPWTRPAQTGNEASIRPHICINEYILGPHITDSYTHIESRRINVYEENPSRVRFIVDLGSVSDSSDRDR